MIRINENGLPELNFNLAFDKKGKLTFSSATSISGLKFVSIEHKNIITKKSDRTIRRRIQKIKKEKPGNRLYVPYFLEFSNKYLISERLFYKPKLNVSNIEINAAYVNYIKNINWDLACCSHYKKNTSAKYLIKKMNTLFDALKVDYKNVMIFYVLEKNINDSGYHVHYVIKCEYDSLYKLKERVKELMKIEGDYFFAENWIRKYNKKLNYAAYMLKRAKLKDNLYDFLV
jgi:hypothetical protein